MRSEQWARASPEKKAARRVKQNARYRNYVAQGICWKCKVGDVQNKGGALCQKCIEDTRLARKSP